MLTYPNLDLIGDFGGDLDTYCLCTIGFLKVVLYLY
jgi:hypothetical protein